MYRAAAAAISRSSSALRTQLARGAGVEPRRLLARGYAATAKEVSFGVGARAAMLQGVNDLADAVKIVVGRTGMETLSNEAGEVTSHLQGMFNRTIRLLEAGTNYVFDGKPPDMKKQDLAKRYSKREDATKDLGEAVELIALLQEGDKDAIEKLSKRTVKVRRQHNDDCKRLLRLIWGFLL